METEAVSATPGQLELVQLYNRIQDLDIATGSGLPQMVVCGMQNAGKSSLLYSITGMRFPIEENRCTTFPTELRLRTLPSGATSYITVSIRPASGASSQQMDILGKFQFPQWDENAMGELFKQAAECIAEACPGTTAGRFFMHTLVITIYKPDTATLDLIDLPGVIKVEDDDQDKNDVRQSHNIVKQYMKQERTIILLVIPATDDLQNQDVIQWAREVDSTGDRTLGIVTKTDRIYGEKTKQKYYNIIRNIDTKSKYHLNLGWHIVKNAGSEDNYLQLSDQWDAEDQLLASAPWQSLPREVKGARSLGQRLVNLSRSGQLRYLPSVITELANHCEKGEVEISLIQKSSLANIPDALKRAKDYFAVLLKSTFLARPTDTIFHFKPELHLLLKLRDSLQTFQTQLSTQGRAIDFAGPGRLKDPQAGVPTYSYVEYCDHLGKTAVDASKAPDFDDFQTIAVALVQKLNPNWPAIFDRFNESLLAHTRTSILGLVETASTLALGKEDGAKAAWITALQKNMSEGCLKRFEVVSAGFLELRRNQELADSKNLRSFLTGAYKGIAATQLAQARRMILEETGDTAIDPSVFLHRQTGTYILALAEGFYEHQVANIRRRVSERAVCDMATGHFSQWPDSDTLEKVVQEMTATADRRLSTAYERLRDRLDSMHDIQRELQNHRAAYLPEASLPKADPTQKRVATSAPGTPVRTKAAKTVIEIPESPV